MYYTCCVEFKLTTGRCSAAEGIPEAIGVTHREVGPGRCEAPGAQTVHAFDSSDDIRRDAGVAWAFVYRGFLKACAFGIADDGAS